MLPGGKSIIMVDKIEAAPGNGGHSRDCRGNRTNRPFLCSIRSRLRCRSFRFLLRPAALSPGFLEAVLIFLVVTLLPGKDVFPVHLMPALVIGTAFFPVFIAVAFIIVTTALSMFIPPAFAIGKTFLPVLFVPAFFGSAISLLLLGC
jgi:hypothetical protein